MIKGKFALTISSKHKALSAFCITSAICLLTSCGSSEPEKSQPQAEVVQPQSSAPAVTTQLPDLPEIFTTTNSGITQVEYANALKGDHKAQYKIGSLCRLLAPPAEQFGQMTAEQRQDFYRKRNDIGFDFMRRAAGSGEFHAQMELAAMYESGTGAEASFRSAKKWFEIALRTAKRSKNSDDIYDAKRELETLAEDMKNSDQAEKDQATQDREINQRMSQFTDSFRMSDLIGHRVTLGIPAGNIKRLWAAKSFPADLDFFTAYNNQDDKGMQTLIDTGKVIILPVNTKALVTGFEKSSDQVHVHIQSGSAIGKDLLVMYNFVKP